MRLVEMVVWGRIFGRLILFATITLFALALIASIFRSPPALSEVLIADKKCGSIPKLHLTAKKIDYKNANIKLLVQKELFQDIPPVAYVYRTIPKGETFATKQKAARIASLLGFKASAYTKPSEVIYRWEDSNRILEIDASTLSFEYKLKSAALPPIPNPDVPPDVSAKREALKAFSYMGVSVDREFLFRVLWNDDRDIEVDSLDKALGIRVDGQRRLVLLKYPRLTEKTSSVAGDLDLLELYNSHGNDITSKEVYVIGEAPFLGGARVYLIKASSKVVDNIGRFVYENWQIEDAPCGTYNIITAEDAFSLLQSGEAVLVYAHEKGGDRLSSLDSGILSDLTVVNIYLAYYQPRKLEKYLQPIYVLEADGKLEDGRSALLYFYVPAIVE